MDHPAIRDQSYDPHVVTTVYDLDESALDLVRLQF